MEMAWKSRAFSSALHHERHNPIVRFPPGLLCSVKHEANRGLTAMAYTWRRGKFVIRYPDLPRQGPEPDGGTVKFLPDSPTLVEGLPRRSGRPPDINGRGISVRL